MSIAGCTINRDPLLPIEAFSIAFSIEEQSAVRQSLREIVIGADIAAVRSAVWSLLTTVDENLEAVRRPVPLRHVYTMNVDGKAITVAVAILCAEEETYFVFEDDHLAEIRALPRLQSLGKPLPDQNANPELQLEAILQYGDSSSMLEFEDGLISCLSRMEQSEEWSAQYQEPPPFLFLFSDDLDDGYQNTLALLERFDAFSIDLGMTSEEVRNRLGRPDFSVTSGDELADRFEPSGTSGWYAPRIAIHYREGRVIKVLSRYVIEWR